MAEKPVRKICKGCRSETVTRDAWAEWNVELQQWVLGAVFDYAFCHNCASRTRIEDVPV